MENTNFIKRNVENTAREYAMIGVMAGNAPYSVEILEDSADYKKVGLFPWSYVLFYDSSIAENMINSNTDFNGLLVYRRYDTDCDDMPPDMEGFYLMSWNQTNGKFDFVPVDHNGKPFSIDKGDIYDYTDNADISIVYCIINKFACFPEMVKG